MRGVNLIHKFYIELVDLEPLLRARFSHVWLHYSETTAKFEGQDKNAMNRLVVEDGDDHVEFLDRPTTIREYEDNELPIIKRFTEEPKKFFAVSYTDEKLLKEVLLVLINQGYGHEILVDDEHGEFSPLHKFINQIGTD
jgi:hypothetical protein